MDTNNLIFTLDSYKAAHWKMMPKGTTHVYSYFESRSGAHYPYSVFFGLQYLVKKWLTKPVTQEMLDEAGDFLDIHFFDNKGLFNKEQWQYIIDKHNGYLPLKIKAVPEGTKVPNSNIMMSVENTDPECYWLTNAMETLLTHIWYPIAVATKSNYIVSELKRMFEKTSDNVDLYKFYLHDFGARGVATMEQVGVGGMAHLLNSLGTDSLMAAPFAEKYYNADKNNLAFSVAASEHSIQTAFGRERQYDVTKDLCERFPDGILSIVSDSYDIEEAVKTYCTDLKDTILKRNGKFVVRPDSPRYYGDKPEFQICWIAEQLWNGFGGTINSKGYKVLNEKVGIIMGDGLVDEDIFRCLKTLEGEGFSAETCVYGQGGGLLQKVNRDTQRSAFKSSAQKRHGWWTDVYKEPRDTSKASKRGRLKLILKDGKYQTVRQEEAGDDLLEVVFENGKLIREQTFDQVKNRLTKQP